MGRRRDIGRPRHRPKFPERFGVIYVDPPWDYQIQISPTWKFDYRTMSNADIAAMPIKDLAADDAVLFMWSTSAHLAKAFNVINAWGFDYKSSFVWNKGNIGWGYYFRGQHELLLMATRGSPGTPPPAARVPSVLNSARSEHSQKPDEVYTIIEQMYPDLPKLELFARQKRDGWASWGNEVRRDYNPKILKRYFRPAA